MATRTIHTSRVIDGYKNIGGGMGGKTQLYFTDSYYPTGEITGRRIYKCSVTLTNFRNLIGDDFYIEISPYYGEDTYRSNYISFGEPYINKGIVTASIDISSILNHDHLLSYAVADGFVVGAVRVSNSSDDGVAEIWGETTMTLVIEYYDEKPELKWVNNKLNIEQVGTEAQITWTAVQSRYGAGTPIYIVFSNDYTELYRGTSTSVTVEPIGFDKEYIYFVFVYSSLVEEGGWSETVSFSVSSTPPPEHYTIRCYVDGAWQDCIVQYYDDSTSDPETRWKECIVKYYDGSNWQNCSF